MMTAHVVFQALKENKVKLDDQVLVSEKAWRTGGSRTFIDVNSRVKLEDLLKGLIVQSGNDAAVALAEHVAGSEETFVKMMNEEARRLGMTATNYVNATGPPDPNHYGTVRDLVKLTESTIREFPEYYPWYAIKEFVHNNNQADEPQPAALAGRVRGWREDRPHQDGWLLPAPIDTAELARPLASPAAGGFAAFEGRVRDQNEGRTVRSLEYEAFEALAVAEGERIVADAVRRHGATLGRCVHRTGRLAVGDVAVWVGVSAPHRAEAFAACREIIDAVKPACRSGRRNTTRTATAAG